MGKIHYYFGWFNSAIAQQVVQALHSDMTDKKSLAIIYATPSDYEQNDGLLGFTKDTWFESAGIIFENYYSIDYRTKKEDAQKIIQNASAILLHGGPEVLQKNFLEEYELPEAVKKSNASVIMGASAGSMNMCAKFIEVPSAKEGDGNYREQGMVYNGLSLDNFALTSHAICTIETLAQDEHTKYDLVPLSQSIDVYVACEESTIRSKNGKLEVMGDVYLISKSKIQKVEARVSF